MDDLISRQAAIDAIERLILPQVKGETAAEEINRVAWRCAINCAEEMIVHLPSAERRGRWLKGDKMADYPRVPYKPWETYCSCCGGIKEQNNDNFCGNCGASMYEVTE